MIKLKNLILDIFFPPKCAACNRIGWFLCPECAGKIQEVKVQACPGCNKISPNGKYCSRCLTKSSLVGVLAYGYFKNEELKSALHEYKYGGIFSLTQCLADFLENKIRDSNIIFDIVTFVPTTKRKESKRGYNQSRLLAEDIASRFEKPIFKDLKKIKITKNQVGLSGKERRENLSGAFKVIKDTSIIYEKRVLLVDDVCTTGSTLNECGKALKEAGAKSIYGVVVAKE